MSFKSGEEGRNEIVKTIRLKVCNFMKKWIEEYFSDFDSELIATLKSFIHEMKMAGDVVYASALQNSLTKNENNANRILNKVFSDKTPEPNVSFEIKILLL